MTVMKTAGALIPVDPTSAHATLVIQGMVDLAYVSTTMHIECYELVI